MSKMCGERDQSEQRSANPLYPVRAEMVFGSYLEPFRRRVERPPEITSARKFKEVVTQGRQVVGAEV